MLELTAPISNSHLWINAFENKSDFIPDRERLKQSFLQFRERAAQLASEIRIDLPELTIHDITHLDSLWETASQIVGSSYKINPAETYVLGGAILLHDLAMSIAATPGGLSALKKTQLWSDLIHTKYQSTEGRQPTAEEVETPNNSIYKDVVFEILRKIHAESAEKLAFTSFDYKETSLYLIEDSEIRLAYGRIIGEIAHSHWWGISEIENKFKETIGTPPWAASTNWTVNPLKIACILRSADAAHLDARRAPIFIRTFRKLNSTSETHWDFQEKLLKPYLKDDALIFTSGQSFPFSEAPSWWVCLDTLKMVDGELRGIDALLSDIGEQRFSAKRVSGVDHPGRLSKYIKTEHWHPVNATVQITDIPRIIKSVGGEELYGADPTVPIRELIQNASDAIRARRVYEDQAPDYGSVDLFLEQAEDNHWLHISDNGTGMSEHVLTNYLLDFGRSFWSSSRAQEEFPGLASSNFKATGKYGIGFFSAFMIAEKIIIKTRHVDKAKSDTIVLEFGCGLHDRPILRPASIGEYSRDGGTTISLKLHTPPREIGGILFSSDEDISISLTQLCLALAPALDVNLTCKENDNPKETTIKSDDWKTINSSELMTRLLDISKTKGTIGLRHRKPDLDSHANIRDIKNDNGDLIGRACITTLSNFNISIPGMVTVGGLSANVLRGISGILSGKTLRASRDVSDILIPEDKLSQWASEQAPLIENFYPDKRDQCSCAHIILICGGEPGTLPVGKLNDEWVTLDQLKEKNKFDSILIIHHYMLTDAIKNLTNVELAPNILTTESTYYQDIISTRRMSIGQRQSNLFRNNQSNTTNSLLSSIAESWDIPPKLLIDNFDRGNFEILPIGNGSNGPIMCHGIKIQKPL